MRKKVNLRLEEETNQHLEIMAGVTKRTKGAILELLIAVAWDKFQTAGNLSAFEKAISLNNGVAKK